MWWVISRAKCGQVFVFVYVRKMARWKSSCPVPASIRQKHRAKWTSSNYKYIFRCILMSVLSSSQYSVEFIETIRALALTLQALPQPVPPGLCLFVIAQTYPVTCILALEFGLYKNISFFFIQMWISCRFSFISRGNTSSFFPVKSYCEKNSKGQVDLEWREILTWMAFTERDVQINGFVRYLEQG